MNLGTVPSAELLVGSVGVATGTQDKSIAQYVLPVVRKLQCHLSLSWDDQSTVASVTLKLGAAPYLGRLGSQVAPILSAPSIPSAAWGNLTGVTKSSMLDLSSMALPAPSIT